MRIRAFPIAPIAVAASLGVASLSPAAAATYDLAVGVDIGGFTTRLIEPVAQDGSVGGRFSLAACDGSVKPVSDCQGAVGAVADISFNGSIFPFISGVVAFTDAGGPTSLIVTFGLVVPTIVGPAAYALEGSVSSSQSRSPGTVLSSLPSGAFIDGGVGSGVVVATVGDGALTQSDSGPASETYGPFTGAFDCGALGCDMLVLQMGVHGLGEDETYTLAGRFDLDPAPTGVVPLPAPLALLASGLGALGLIARRRRA